MDGDKYREIVGGMRKAAENPADFRPGWRDYIARFTTKGLVCLALVAAGAGLIGYGAKGLAEKSVDLIERANEAAVRTLDERLERECSEAIEYDSEWDSYFYFIIEGSLVAGPALAMGMMRQPPKRVSYRPSGESKGRERL
ncbi:MAG: hypothetical protein ABH864_03760 [archaeon]